MAEISIDLVPDPARDARARRAALALLTATLYDPDVAGHKELSSVALHDLIELVVGDIGQVREESAAALQVLLTAVARQYSAFASLAYALAGEAFLAGQQSPHAQEPDLAEVLNRVSRALDRNPE
jgi:hypothetical protein